MASNVPGGATATPETPPPHPVVPPASSATMLPTMSGPTPSPTQHPTYPPPYAPTPNYYPYPATRPPNARGRTHWGVWAIGGILGITLVGGLAVVIMITLLGGLLSTAGQIEQTSTTTKTFTVSGMPSLVVSNSAGNVTVRTGSGNQVAVQATKRVWGGNAPIAQRGLSNIVVNMAQNGTAINVRAQFNTTVFDGGMTRRSVDLLITVPAQSNADVNLGAGNLDVGQISGTVKLVSGAGNMTLNGLTFQGSSVLTTGAGNITAACAIASGATVDIHIGAGNATLTLPADTPAHLEASTGVGNMTMSGWQMSPSGSGVGHQMSGDLNANPTARLTIQIGTGNLTMTSR